MNMRETSAARSSPLERSLGVCLFAVAILSMAAGTILEITKTQSDESFLLTLLFAVLLSVVVSSFAVVGLVLLFRLRRNPLGWLFLVVALSFTVILMGENYAARGLIHAPGSLPGARFAAWLITWTFAPALTSLTMFLPLLFPTGRLLSRRWRPVLWGAFLTLGLMVLSNAFTRTQPIPGIQNPYEIPRLASLWRTLQVVSLPVVLLSMAGAFASLVVRYRRSRGIERQQMKWFIFASALVPAPFIAYEINETVSEVLGPLVIPLFPIAVAIAILKHRLYDIDVVINKTVVYGALAAFITAVYAGVVVGVGALVGSGDEPNLGLSLAATAIVAIAFQPVRQRVQRFANKLVYGERVTPYEAVTSFSHRMSESLSLDQVLPQMAEAAAKGVGGSRSRVKLLLPGGGEQVVAWPADDSVDAFDRTLAVVHQGEEVGEISVAKAPGEQLTKGEEKLLQDLASQAGLAMRNLRLTGELQQKLIELQQSRKRIVAAQDEERRRMERDIHDGAQQQLVSMSVKLGLVRNLLARDAEKAEGMLDELRGETSEAVETLRDLARGLFPEILTEQGLRSALESHIAKMGLNATVVGEIGRFDLQIEANIYFCIREALQNASKHAPGAPIVVSLDYEDGQLLFSVKDEGPGFDPKTAKRGSGLQNMKDRAEALGGSFQIESARESGTELRARIPARAMERAAP